MSNLDIEDIAKALNKAKEAKDLLDSILLYYDVYTGQFEKIGKLDAEYMPKLDNGQYYKGSLNNKIREYLKFDDSE